MPTSGQRYPKVALENASLDRKTALETQLRTEFSQLGPQPGQFTKYFIPTPKKKQCCFYVNLVHFKHLQTPFLGCNLPLWNRWFPRCSNGAWPWPPRDQVLDSSRLCLSGRIQSPSWSRACHHVVLSAQLCGSITCGKYSLKNVWSSCRSFGLS